MIKRLKGEQPKPIARSQGEVTFNISGENNHVTTNINNFNVLKDPEARRAIAKFARPTFRPGIDSMQIGPLDEQKAIITKEDAIYLREEFANLARKALRKRSEM